MPSRPMRQTCSNTVGPSPVRCSVNWMEHRLALPISLASRRLRLISGRSRRSLPSWSIRSKEAADAQAIPAHKQPVAIMLDFVDPERARRRSGRLRRQAWFDEAGGTLQDHARRIGQWPGGSTAPNMVASGPRCWRCGRGSRSGCRSATPVADRSPSVTKAGRSLRMRRF